MFEKKTNTHKNRKYRNTKYKNIQKSVTEKTKSYCFEKLWRWIPKATALESSNRKIRIRIEFRSPKPRSHRTKAMVSPTPSSYLTPTQKYAAGALFGLALHQAQLHQTHPLGLSTDEFPSSSSSTTRAVFEDPELWVHHTSGLLRPIFMYVSLSSFSCSPFRLHDT